MSKNFDETVCLQSEKRREWIREIRGERLQGIAKGATSAPSLVSSLAASFPERNECPGTHCSLIQQDREDRSAREIEVKGNREERKGESQMGEENWQTCWYCRDQQRVCRMTQTSAEKLEHTGPVEKK